MLCVFVLLIIDSGSFHLWHHRLFPHRGPGLVQEKPFAQAKVGQLNVPVAVDENVLWLEVTVQNFEAVQVLEGEHDLCRVKPDVSLREPLLLVQAMEQCAACLEVQEQVKFAPALE